MLNNLFSFTDNYNLNTHSQAGIKNKYIVNMYSALYIFIGFFSKIFQNTLTNLYSSKLQLNRLPFRILPNTVKQFFINFVSLENWINFFKRVKNDKNVYILREKKNPLTHKIWCVFYKNKTANFNELNVRCKHNKNVSNLYYHISLNGLSTFRVIIFYYFNKVSLTNYPYFYWSYYNLYNNYKLNNKSQNNRTVMFYIYINSIKNYINNNTNVHFIKTSLNTFKGVRATLKYTENVSLIKIIATIKTLQDDIRTTTIQQQILYERNILKNYSVFFKISKTNLIFYLNGVVYNSITTFKKNVRNNTKTSLDFINVLWYNKIHNTILETTKNNVILFLRAARHFNKGRYSRNRQLYRTGVYWCVWLNVVIVYALHYYFYRVVFSFGYLWVPFCLMILVMFSSRLYKYRYYSANHLVIEFKEFNNFIYYNTVLANVSLNNCIDYLTKKLISQYSNYVFLINKLITNRIK